MTYAGDRAGSAIKRYAGISRQTEEEEGEVDVQALGAALLGKSTEEEVTYCLDELINARLIKAR